MKASILNADRVESKAQGKLEIRFRCTCEDSEVRFARLSLSDTIISTGENKDKPMYVATADRVRRALKLDPATSVKDSVSAETIQGFIGMDVALTMGTYVNPTTKVEQESVEGISFSGVGGLTDEEVASKFDYIK